MFLDTDQRSLEIKLNSSVTTNELPWSAHYVEMNTTTFALTKASQATGVTTSTTAATMVAAPVANRTRQIKLLTVQNADTATATIILQLNNNGTTRVIWRGALAAGEVLVYEEGRGFVVTDTAGALKRSVSGGSGYVLPADVALTDAANVFTLDQTLQKAEPQLQLTTSGSKSYHFGSYQDAFPGAYIGSNLRWTSGGWYLDDITAVGSVIIFGRDGSAVLYTATAGANPRTLSVGGSFQTSLITTGQIAFPATQVPSSDANTLDDYEEGTWTPVLGGLTSEVGQAYSTQSGRYVKVGGLVHAQCYLQFSNKGTITGGLVVKNLPFSAGGGSSYFAASVGYMTNMAAGTVNPKHSIMGYVEASQNYIKMLAVNDFVSVNPTIMDGTDVNNTTQLIVAVTYTVT